MTIWVNITKLPIKCDKNDNFYCTSDDEWLIPFIVSGSVDANRTIYYMTSPPSVKVISHTEFDNIEESLYSEIYDLEFDLPEDKKLYFHLKYLSC